jgi:hypothetical protein
MTVQVADAYEHVQRLISVVKMATVLEECTTEEQRSVVHLRGRTKGLNAQNIHNNLFVVGKCSSLKAVPPWWKNFADEEVETEMRKWLRQQTKDFCVADFDALVKR